MLIAMFSPYVKNCSLVFLELDKTVKTLLSPLPRHLTVASAKIWSSYEQNRGNFRKKPRPQESFYGTRSSGSDFATSRW
jgi:hypothetical protein